MAVHYRTGSGARTRRTTSRGAPVSKGYDVQKQGTLAGGAKQAVAPTGTTGGGGGGGEQGEPGFGGTPSTGGEAALTTTPDAVQPDAYAAPSTPVIPANPLVARNLGFNPDVMGPQAGTTQQGTDAFGKPLTSAKADLQQGGAEAANQRVKNVAEDYRRGTVGIDQYRDALTSAAMNRPWEPSLQNYQKELLRQNINPETIGNAVVQRNPLGQVTGMNVPSIGQIDQMYKDQAAVSAEHARQEHLAHLSQRAREYANADVFQQRANQYIPQLGMSSEVANRQYLDRILGSQQSSLAAINPALLTAAPAQFRQVAPDADLIRQQMLKVTEGNRLKQKKAKVKPGEEEEEET